MILAVRRVKLLDLMENARTAHHSSTHPLMPDLALSKFAKATRS